MERPGMMTYQLTSVLLCCLMLMSCSNSQDQASNEQEPLPIEEETFTRLPLRVNIDYLRMRAEPGETGSVLQTFSQGDVLYDLGEASSFTTRIKLRGIEFNEPWILVEDKEGNQGWVYAGGLDFRFQSQSATARRLMQYRLQAVFGEALADSVRSYRERYLAAADSRTFAQAYQLGMRLRDTLNHILVNKVEIQDYDRLPDLFWLKEALPGFIPQLVAEGTLYQLFANYKDMGSRVARTSGKEDDRFVELCINIFPQDSIEYYFPGWFLQTWDYGGHSELGKGVHFNLLDRMNRILAQEDLFEAEIESYKERLLDDITNTDNSYWYPQDAILKELNQIQEANFGLLDDRDQAALEVRIRQFENPDANQIKLNVRSGVHDD